MKSGVAWLFVNQIEFNRDLVLKCRLPHFELHCPPLHWSSITENISFKGEFTLTSSSVKVGFTDITISILEKSRSLRFLRGFASAVREIQHAKAAKASWVLLRNLSIFCAGGNIIHKKNQRILLPMPTAYGLGTSNKLDTDTFVIFIFLELFKPISLFV